MTELNDAERVIQELHSAVNELIQATAQIGQALSVHLPNADIDPIVPALQRAGKNLDSATRIMNSHGMNPVTPKFPGT